MREVDITQKTSGIITEKTTLQTVAYALYKYLIGTVTISRNTDTVSRNYKIKNVKIKYYFAWVTAICCITFYFKVIMLILSISYSIEKIGPTPSLSHKSTEQQLYFWFVVGLRCLEIKLNSINRLQLFHHLPQNERQNSYLHS